MNPPQNLEQKAKEVWNSALDRDATNSDKGDWLPTFNEIIITKIAASLLEARDEALDLAIGIIENPRDETLGVKAYRVERLKGKR